MKPKRDKKTGRYKAVTATTITAKGYVRITAGPQRGMYLHRLLAAFKEGRPLRKDEDSHHRNKVKLDFSYENIQTLGHQHHGCVSAKQHFVLEQKDIHLKGEWDAWWEQERSEVGGGRCRLPLN